MRVLKRIGGTLMLPVAMYLIMMIICFSQGKMFFGSWAMWRTLIPDIAVSVTCAMGIGLQFKYGRFDFSGGAMMLLATIIAGNVALKNGSNVWLFCALCLVLCVAFSVLTAALYVFGRLPIVIATIGMALLYESITCLIYNGAGTNLVANKTLKALSTYPTAILPLIGAIIVYAVYSLLTVSGRQSKLLANNQGASVNIGIKEGRNVFVSYIFSGLIFGFATMIYASTGLMKASFSSLSTVGSLFSNILPVFIGLMLCRFCNDTIGVIMGAITLCLMSFGLEVIFSAEMGSAISTVITGAFILVINVVDAQGGNLINAIKKIFKKEKVA